VDAALEAWARRADVWWPPLRRDPYSLLRTGKRCAHAGVPSVEAGGGGGEAEWPAPAAVEVVAAYSLVRDLPAWTTDDLRRGGRTTTRRSTSDRHRGWLSHGALGARVLDAGWPHRPSSRHAPGDRLELFRAAGAGRHDRGAGAPSAAEGRRLAAASLEDVHRRKDGRLIAARV